MVLILERKPPLWTSINGYDLGHSGINTISSYALDFEKFNP